MTLQAILIHAAAAGTPLYADPTFWVAICVLTFLGFLVFKGVHKAIGKALDERSTKISEELAEARRLRCLLYTSPSPRDATLSRMPSSA